MSAAVNTPTPFLPITSLQPQYFQAVTNSFVRRRSTIPPIFNNFRTLSVATGVVPLSCQSFGAITAAGSCSPPFSGFTRFGLERFSHNRSFRSFGANHRAIPPSFSGENNPECKTLGGCHPHSMLYIAIQCTETPFGERLGAIPPTPVD